MYALYADTTLERNPFLTFFLEFVVSSEYQRGNSLEQQFVCCILEGTIIIAVVLNILQLNLLLKHDHPKKNNNK